MIISDSYFVEEPPKDFTRFKKLINRIYPDITLITYEDLYRLSVSIDTFHEDDYYGGDGSDYAYYQCNVPILYEELKKLGKV